MLLVDPAGVLWMIAGSFSVGASFVCAKKVREPIRSSPLTGYQIGIAFMLSSRHR